MNQLLYFALHPIRTWKNIQYRMSKVDSNKRHIFIIGVPRSGTTLLKTLLVAHPKIGGSDYESTGIFGFRDIFRYRMGEVSPEHMSQLLGQSRDIIGFYDHVIAALLKRSGKQIFVDKLQMKAYRLSYVQRHFPHVLFIHIVRDGRDCYCSALHHPNVRQTSSISNFAKYWAHSVALPERLIPSDCLFSLRYEDLTTDAESTVARLMNFLELEYWEKQVEVEHYSVTTSMRKRKVHENLTKPISARSQGRWKRELSEKENELFCQIAGRTLAQFGYDSAEQTTRSVDEQSKQVHG